MKKKMTKKKEKIQKEKKNENINDMLHLFDKEEQKINKAINEMMQ